MEPIVDKACVALWNQILQDASDNMVVTYEQAGSATSGTRKGPPLFLQMNQNLPRKWVWIAGIHPLLVNPESVGYPGCSWEQSIPATTPISIPLGPAERDGLLPQGSGIFMTGS